MDTNGDLAVGILDGPSTGDIVIYKNASGSGTFIKTPLAREYFDGYDDNGNLFFDGFTSGSAFQLDELPKGSTKVQTITTSNTVAVPRLRPVGRQVRDRLRSASEQDVSVHDQRNEGDVEGHRIVLGFQRLRADLDRDRRCLLRGRG